MSSSISSSSSSNSQKKTKNKIYTKEINSLIEKIIKSKKNTFKLTKIHGSTGNGVGQGMGPGGSVTSNNSSNLSKTSINNNMTSNNNTNLNSNPNINPVTAPNNIINNINNNINNNIILNINNNININHTNCNSCNNNSNSYTNPKTFSNNLNHSLNKENEIKCVKITKNYKNNRSINQSSNSSFHDPSLSYINNSNNIGHNCAKIKEFTKQMDDYIQKANDPKFKETAETKKNLSTLITDMLNYLKQENNLNNIIYENESFINNFLDLFSLIIFSPLKITHKYKVTDMNYYVLDVSLSKTAIEEFAMNLNDTDSNGLGSQSLIRIKNESWKDSLNLYDILITLLNNIPTINAFISKMPLNFIKNLVSCLNTLDNEERVLIKMIVYKIYISSLTYRNFILKNMSNMIIDISNDSNNKLLCLAECLDFLKCVLLGAKKPINDNYVNLVKNVICPLLKCKLTFKQNVLKETLVKLMNFDTKLLNIILEYLIKTWPVRYPERIIVYLDIIENIFCNNDIINNVNDDLMSVILKKIKCCFSDLSFLIADRSLIFFKNENFLAILIKFKMEKIFLKKIVDNIENHWSQEIKIISKIVISKITKRDEKILNLLSNKERKIIDDFKFDTNETEDIWDIQFNLKGD